MKKKFLVFPLALLLAVAGTSSWSRSRGQAPASDTTPPPSGQKAPAIRTTTRLVQLNVIAEDKNGNPVTDLSRDDFTLTDKGQPQEIRIFSMESTREIPFSGPPLPLRDNRSGRMGSLTIPLQEKAAKAPG